MLLFRSEESVAGWCAGRGMSQRPIIRLDQLWHLATTWYANRLTVDSRRPGPEEMVGIFSSIGLDGPFWDPKADAWSPST